MFSSRIRGITLLHQIIQILGVLVIFWAVFLIVDGLRFQWTLNPRNYVNGTIVILVASFVEFLTRPGATQSLSGLSNQLLMNVSQRQLLFALVSIFGTFAMLKDDSLSRVFLSVFFVLYFLWIAWSNRFGFKFLNRFLYRNREKGLFPTLMVGTPPALKRFCDHPERPNPPGTDILGYIPLPDESGSAAISIDFPMLGSFTELRAICEETRIKALLLLGISDRRDLVPVVSQLSTELGLRSAWIDDVEEKYGSGSDPFHTRSFSVVTHGREPLEDPVNRAAKRILDLICSGSGVLLILPPTMLFVALLHRLYSPGPLFYRQERTGRNGEIFKILKFRSMTVARNDKFVQASKDDTRIFTGGNFIRKYGIDELPQLVNVFTGEMSMVGPRPHPVDLDDSLAPNNQTYRLRNLAKPGIAGLAQSRGWRGETRQARQIRNRLRLDLFYIRNWSISFDIRILFETAWQVIRPTRSHH